MTITTHAISTYMDRAGVESTVQSTDELRAIGNCAKLHGVQARTKKGRGRNNTDVVRVLEGCDARGRKWNLFVRGRVLLTAHGPY